MLYKECRGCKYWDKGLGLCDYADKTGKLRITTKGGDFERLLNEPCEVRLAGRRFTRSGEAWRGGLHTVMPRRRVRRKDGA